MGSLRLVLITLLLLAGGVWSRAAELTEPEVQHLLESAKAVMTAFQKGDVDAIIRSTHPAILKLAPSREAFEKITREAMKSLSSQASVEEVTWGKPGTLYQSGDEEVTFLPRTMVMRVGERRGKAVSFMIVARPRGTSTWYFLDSASLRQKPEMLWKLFPGLPADVQLPPNKVEVLP